MSLCGVGVRKGDGGRGRESVAGEWRMEVWYGGSTLNITCTPQLDESLCS